MTSTMKTFRPLAPLLLALAACSLAACSSSSLHGANRGLLDASRASIEAGRYREAIQSAESVLASTGEAQNDYRLQRFFAAHLVSRAHAEAAFAAPFLSEPVVGTQFSLTGNASSRRPSSVAHLIAACWWADWTRQWFAGVSDAPREVRGEAVLPPDLAQFGPLNALAQANLLTLAIYCRLDFQDKVADIVTGIPELRSLDSCEAVLEAARVPASARVWVYAGVFEQLTEEDQREAYRFGIRARSAALAEAQSGFGAAHRKAIADWILKESQFVFRSPSGSVFDPNLDGCTIDGTPNLEYIAVRRGQ